MKLLAVAHDTEFSDGANRSLLTTLLGLREQHRVDVEVLLPWRKGALNRQLDAAGIPWMHYPYFGLMSGIRGDSKDLLRYGKAYLGYPWERLLSRYLADKLTLRGYDLIYTNTRRPVVGALMADRMNIPHVYHVQEYGAEKPIWGPWSYQEILDHSIRVILPSQALRRQFIDHVPGGRLVAVHHGVESPLGLRKPGRNGKGFHLLITGALAPDKGHQDALFALKRLVSDGIQDITLHVVGTPPKRTHIGWYARDLRQMAEDWGLLEHVIFHGEVQDMTSLRGQMDVELVCAVREAFGRAAVEGMRSHLLVVGADSGGIPEIVEDGVTGLLYRPGDPDGLAERLRVVYWNPDYQERLADAGYEHAQTHFLPEENVQRIHDIMSDAIEAFHVNWKRSREQARLETAKNRRIRD